MQMADLTSNALAFIAQNFVAGASLAHDLAGVADGLLTRLAKVRLVLQDMHLCACSCHASMPCSTIIEERARMQAFELF